MKLALMFALLALAACAGAANTQNADTPTSQLTSDNAEVQRYLRMGAKAEAENKLDVAAFFYRAAAMADEQDPAPRLASARLFERMGLYKSAAALYEALAVEQADDELRFVAARTWLKARDYEAAAMRYEELAAASQNWRAYNGLGTARFFMGDAEAASRAFATALDKAPRADRAVVLANQVRAELLGGNAKAVIDRLAPLQQAGELDEVQTKLLAYAYGAVGRVAEAQKLGVASPPTQEALRALLLGDSAGQVTPPAKPAAKPKAATGPVQPKKLPESMDVLE